jgi:ISXO2-like transposase domain
MMASKKGMSAFQIGRLLGLGKKDGLVCLPSHSRVIGRINPDMLGGEGKAVEIDESFVGGLEKNKHESKRKYKGTRGTGKEAVFALVERGGRVRSHHVPVVNAKTLRPILQAQLKGKTLVITDEGAAMKLVGPEFGRNESVNHSIGESNTGEIVSLQNGLSCDS